MTNKINHLSIYKIQSKAITYLSGIILLFACSQIYIPIEPVPITLQTVGIMLVALLYNLQDGIITYSLYIILGALGVPVFAEYSSGISVLSGPTLGYLIGFLIAIYVMNKIKTKIGTNSFLKILFNCCLGTILIFICGIAWLSTIFGIENAIAVGLVPFIIPGIVKAIFLSGLLKITKFPR